jgi:hypothetical protein
MKSFSVVAGEAHGVDGVRWAGLGLLPRTDQLSQPFRSLSHHVDPPLQLALQFGDVHLVRNCPT